MENFICINCKKEFNYSINKKRLIENYNINKSINALELSKEFGVSRKTIYKYINQINKEFPSLIKKQLHNSSIKERFIEIYNNNKLINKSKLSKELGISRKTIYKYINQINK